MDFSGAQLVATILGTPELYELWYVLSYFEQLVFT